jgi:biotin carboxyl carrier protein
MTQGSPTLFRQEARKHASGQDGDVLRLSSRWTRISYGLLVLAFVAGVAFCAFGTLHEYASGPAVVWVSGRVHVTATVSGTVSAIEVRAGQRVEAGQLIARFYAAPETAELDRIEREFNLQLLRTLRDPSDRTASEALTSLRAQKELAAARLEHLSVQAPEAGYIGDVRIHPGQHLSAGDIVVTLASERQKCSIVAMLPAHYRPQLHAGMSMRFEATGYRYAYQEMTITSVGAEIIGPAEVKRYLGQEIDDTLDVRGPVVLVEATPPSPTFLVDGQSFDFFHGMNGTAEARVRSERILIALIPGLRVVFEEPHE